jgi:hypothetical protein
MKSVAVFLVVVVGGSFVLPLSSGAQTKLKPKGCPTPRAVTVSRDLIVSSTTKKPAAGFVNPNGDKSDKLNPVHGVVFIEEVSFGLGQQIGRAVGFTGPYSEVARRLCSSPPMIQTLGGGMSVPIFVWGGSVFLSNRNGGLLEVRSQAPGFGSKGVCLGGSFLRTKPGAVFFVGAPWPNCENRNDELVFVKSDGTAVPIQDALSKCVRDQNVGSVDNDAVIPSFPICPSNAGIPYLLPSG